MMIPGFVTIIVIEVSYVSHKFFCSAQNVTDVSFFVVTPFFLVYGAEAVLPSDLLHNAPRVELFSEEEAK